MASATDSATSSVLGSKFGWLLLHFFVWVLSVPLLGAFWVQFAWKEDPCVLCLLQRMCMILAGLGPVWILSQVAASSHQTTATLWSRGFGVSVLAATLGLAISLRQILLHILPDDPGFGTPVLGYHLYSWAFGIFIVVLLCSGACMLFASALAPAASAGQRSKLTPITVGFFGLLIVGNTLVVSFNAAATLLTAAAP
jgi:disulfide bond formation protein DsbB